MVQNRGAGVQHLLRNDIVSGALPLGSRLQIDALAARYGVSHTPVREALRELRGEGLVVIEPNRGARVRGVDPGFVQNVFDVRSALETMMAARAATLRPAATIGALHVRQAAFERAVKTGDAGTIFAANREFHDVIYLAAGNPEAFAFFKRHWMLVAALFASFGHDPDRMTGEVPEHRYLIHAIERGDSAAAAAVMAAHIARAKNDIIGRMSADRPPPASIPPRTIRRRK